MVAAARAKRFCTNIVAARAYCTPQTEAGPAGISRPGPLSVLCRFDRTYSLTWQYAHDGGSWHSKHGCAPSFFTMFGWYVRHGCCWTAPVW